MRTLNKTTQRVRDRKKSSRKVHGGFAQKRPLHRKIHLVGGIWSWQMQGDYLSIRTPCGAQTARLSIIEFLNNAIAAEVAEHGDQGQCRTWTWDELERAHWKGYGYSERAVTPRRVRSYIERMLLPEIQKSKQAMLVGTIRCQ